MTTICTMPNAGCDTLVEGLRAEFGSLLAARIIEAEEADFVWDSRVRERYLGQHFDVGFPLDEDERELSRIAALSRLDGRWYAAVCLVDGDGRAVDLLWKTPFESRVDAEIGFCRAR